MDLRDRGGAVRLYAGRLVAAARVADARAGIAVRDWRWRDVVPCRPRSDAGSRRAAISAVRGRRDDRRLPDDIHSLRSFFLDSRACFFAGGGCLAWGGGSVAGRGGLRLPPGGRRLR